MRLPEEGGGVNVALLGVGMELESSTTYNLGLPENIGLFLWRATLRTVLG